MRQTLAPRVVTTGLLVGANVAIYATDWLPFLWPVMALVDAGAIVAWRRRTREQV